MVVEPSTVEHAPESQAPAEEAVTAPPSSAPPRRGRGRPKGSKTKNGNGGHKGETPPKMTAIDVTQDLAKKLDQFMPEISVGRPVKIALLLKEVEDQKKQIDELKGWLRVRLSQ